MPDLIKPHRLALDDRFSVLGFTIRTNAPAKWFEVALATDPQLFQASAKSQRTAANFYSTRAAGPLLAERNEAVYLAPAEVLSRFAGQPKLYYALATFADPGRSQVEVANMPADGSPWIDLRGFTGRALRRLRTAPARASNGNGYGPGDARALEWAGDALQIGMQPVSAAPANGSSGRTPANGAAAPAPASSAPAPGANGAAVSQGYALDYDDGFGRDLWARLQEAEQEGQIVEGGIEEPIPDNGALPQPQSYSFPLETSEYPQASRFAPAASNNYRHSTAPRAIERVVIHITDGRENISGPISWFQNPNQKNRRDEPINVSAHYVIGQDGEVVQMVKHNDVAWHAGRANGNSIGIEHCARQPREFGASDPGLYPAEAQYCASAALVNWLCQQYGIPMDRQHVLGHSEADTRTTHTSCPNAVWDWDYFMGLVTSASCYPRPATGQSLAYGRSAPAAYGQPRNGNSVQPPAASALTGQRPPVARPLAHNIIRPLYQPRDPEEAKRFMREWQHRRERWRAGVPNTRFFPHSAICQFIIDLPDGAYVGTGFYIAPDRILTCAHNLDGATSITIIPGKNEDDEPGFPSFTVPPSAWAMHPNYQSHSRDFDLGVITVDTPPPHGQYFETLEELLESRDSPIIVCGYAAESVSYNKQHLDGDHIRTPGDSFQTFQYNLQTEGGNSGSPVFYVWGHEDEQRQMSVMEIRVVGVHTSIALDPGTNRYSDTLNEGCRLTAEKIQWIRSVGRNYSAGAQALSAGRRPAPARPMAVAIPFSDEIPLDPGNGGLSIGSDALAVGDIILSTTDAFVSDAIRGFTSAPVSHSMIYTGDGDQVVEAIGEGVVFRPLRDALRDATVAVAFRHPNLTEEQGWRVRDFLGQQIGRSYNRWGVVRQAVFQIDRRVCDLLSDAARDRCVNFVGRVDLGTADNETFFCSQLTLAAYEAAAVPLTSSPPHWNTAGDIAELRLSGLLNYVGHLKAPPLGASQGLSRQSAAQPANGRAPNHSGAPVYARGQAAQPRPDQPHGSTARARAFTDQATVDALPLALKEPDYSDELSDEPDAERAAPQPAATFTNEEIYRIIREVAVADSGDAVYAAISTDSDYETAGVASPRQFGLAFGLTLFTQESGRLGSVLRLMKQRDPAMYAEIFGADAEALLATANAATAAERLLPVGGEPLWSEKWIERFRRAGAAQAFQFAQNEEAIEGQFRPMLTVVYELGLTTDRALAMAYDRVVTQGLGGGLRWIVQTAGPLGAAAQRNHAMQMLGHGDLAQFQSSTGWLTADGRFTHATHAALVGALRRQGLATLPSPDDLAWRLYASATGTAKRRLRRLLESNNFTDVVYRLN